METPRSIEQASYWLATRPPTPAREAGGKLDCDIAIIGGGNMGEALLAGLLVLQISLGAIHVLLELPPSSGSRLPAFTVERIPESYVPPPGAARFTLAP